jgi:hypothetical protein
VVGCRYYEPLSAHGDFPEAGRCKDAVVLSGANHIRRTLCHRRIEPGADEQAASREVPAELHATQ